MLNFAGVALKISVDVLSVARTPVAFVSKVAPPAMRIFVKSRASNSLRTASQSELSLALL